MAEKNIYIDPDEFAKLVVSSESLYTGDLEDTAKQNLTLYLVSKLLAERFNDVESKSFNIDVAKDQDFEMTIGRLQTMAFLQVANRKKK
ncbi:hypothetical protein [Latilactobacillus fragifolii]|uniref:hypothetical protein n=1 Tax=Latilactobacillus fragifolii TaxID=2814244 RepID=UPI001ABA4AB3|nr:hypothetical protein [Latilactobacillus fragifolii]